MAQSGHWDQSPFQNKANTQKRRTCLFTNPTVAQST